jgi:FkbM family methyltransferase
MRTLRLIRSSARLSAALFDHAFPAHRVLYDTYKRIGERRQIRLIRQLVKPGDRVADVGANIGFYTSVLARRVGERGRVYAFEPDVRNFAHLSARVRGLPQVERVQAAVTDCDGTIDLYRSPDLHVDHRTYETDEPRARVAVPAVSLDRFLADAPPLQFLKMDVQGAEYRALRGMAGVVARSPELVILMEVWPFVHDRFGAGTRALLDLLWSWGLKVWRLDTQDAGRRTALTPDTPLPERDDPDRYFDVLCGRAETLNA